MTARHAHDWHHGEEWSVCLGCMAVAEPDGTPVDCLERGPDCAGPVTLASSPGGGSWPRCEHHAAARWERWENSAERWSDSDVPPPWLDPSYAGERWTDE